MRGEEGAVSAAVPLHFKLVYGCMEAARPDGGIEVYTLSDFEVADEVAEAFGEELTQHQHIVMELVLEAKSIIGKQDVSGSLEENGALCLAVAQ